MNSLIAGLVAVIGALGGFYFGAKYGQGHPPSSSTATTVASATTANQSGGAGAGANGGGGAAAPFGSAASGQITAVNGNTITVHDRQSNKDVKVNIAAARITKTDQGTASDLTTNTAVTVVGQTGADGTVSAQLITIGGGGAGGFGGGRRGGGSPSPAG